MRGGAYRSSSHCVPTVALEIAALPRFVRAARSVGKAPLAMIGITMALVILVFSAVMEYYVAAEYWAERSFR